MTAKQKKDHIKSWTEQVFDRDAEIDPDDDYVWRGVAVGFFIGRGCTIEDAHKLELTVYKMGLV